jgi:hypothetical protein
MTDGAEFTLTQVLVDQNLRQGELIREGEGQVRRGRVRVKRSTGVSSAYGPVTA